MMAWLWAASVLILVAAVWIVWRSRQAQVRRLERLLDMGDERLERLQREFERFAPPDVVERLTDASASFVPQLRQVTMLFADLRGFTALCDKLDPAVTVHILNDYFALMNQAVERHHGHITELVGDGLLALFGALEPNPWQCRDAVLAAQAMRAALERYNGELVARGLPPLHFGIGIHSGEVIAGIIGTAGLAKFSVTGDPINVASRVEGLTRQLHVDLLITDEVRRALDDGFSLRAMPATLVKGKSLPLQTWHVEPDAAAQGDGAAEKVRSPASDPARTTADAP